MHYIVLYPRNGDRIVTIDSVTSLYPVYTNAFLLHCPLTRNWKWLTPRTATLLMAWRDLRLPSKVPQNPISRERHHIYHTGWGCNSAAAAARRSILSLASSWRSRPTRGLLLSCAAGAVDCHTHVRPSRCVLKDSEVKMSSAVPQCPLLVTPRAFCSQPQIDLRPEWPISLVFLTLMRLWLISNAPTQLAYVLAIFVII